MRFRNVRYREALLVVFATLLVAFVIQTHSNVRAAQPGSGATGPNAAPLEPQTAQSMEASRMQQGLPPANPEQTKEAKLQEIKQDTDELAELVTSLKSDLAKGDAFGLQKKEMAKRADKIEKLARRIKDSFKGY